MTMVSSFPLFWPAETFGVIQGVIRRLNMRQVVHCRTGLEHIPAVEITNELSALGSISEMV